MEVVAVNMHWHGALLNPTGETVYVAPGNAGTALEKGVENVPLASDDIDALLEFARTTDWPDHRRPRGTVGRRYRRPFHAAGLPVSAPQLPLPSLKAPRPLPRTSWPATAFPQRPMETLPISMRPSLSSTSKAHPSWSRLTGWPQARA